MDNYQIKGFTEISLTDYPLGNPGAILFFAHCPLRCKYCQAAHLVDSHHLLPSLSFKQILRTLEELQDIVKGITITGGEASVLPQMDLILKTIKAMGFKIKLDTYGANIPLIESWINNHIIDMLALDVKGPWEKYTLITQRPWGQAQLNQLRDWIKQIIKDNPIEYELRTTVHKKLLSKQDLFFLANELDGASLWVLQNYKPVPGFDNSLQQDLTYSDAELNGITKIIRKNTNINCYLRGYEKTAHSNRSY